MEDQGTRRKIIREWMALPKKKRQTEEQVATFAKKRPSKTSSTAVGAIRPEVSARSVSETNGMAFAARWQIVIRWLSRQLSHHLAFSSARLTHVTSLGWQAIPMFEQLKFSPD